MLLGAGNAPQARAVEALAAAALATAVAAPARAEELPVEIASEPPGATIYLEEVGGEHLGDTPFRGSLPEGVHTIILELEGHELGVEVIDVRPAPQPQRVQIELVELRHGVLAIERAEGAPELGGAEVRLNGEPIGEAPGEIDVPVGAHHVEIVKPGYELYETWIEVEEGGNLDIRAALEPEPDTEIPAEEPEPDGDAPPIVTAGGGLEFGGRSFAYDNPQTANLRPYSAGGVPILRGRVELFPLSRSGSEWLEEIALVGRAGWAFPISSSTDDGQVIGTSWNEYDIALRALVPVTGDVSAGLAGAHGRTRFGFEDGELAGEVPDVEYRYGRLGAVGATRVDRYEVRGAASYIGPYERGETASRFRDADVWGLDVQASVSAQFAPRFDARLGVKYTRYAYELDAGDDDDHRADGGADQFFGLTVGGFFSY